MSPPLAQVLDFLLGLFEGAPTSKGVGYSAMNTARSALSTIIFIDGHPVGQHPLVRRFMRSVFNVRPALPKYSITWDADIVLTYLRSLSPNKAIPIRLLSHKLTMLLMLLSGQRAQTIHLLDIRNMSLSFSRVTFTIGDLLKTSSPRSHVSQISFKAYAPDRRLCVVTALKRYLARTLDQRGATKALFLTLRPPYGPASRDTIRRWIRQCMADAGIDLQVFSPHSVRAASTSKAATKLPLSTIVRTVGWSSDCTFTKYYRKPIATNYDFGGAVVQ